MVFNDPRIDSQFEKKVWVCLGDLNEFSVKQVMVKMVRSITGEKSDDLEPDQLHKCLRENLSNKRFLLVLDDVWVVHRAKWLEFKELLMCGGSGGSKVLVTTRNSPVAINMDSSLAHSLEGLPHDECVSLFKKFAFKEGEDDQNLMKVGDVIVGKCKGVPLAVKTLGCMLFSKHKTADWEFVRDNEIWELDQEKDDILPALKISYDLLPFTLKQCFLHCCIFPKDYDFLSVNLINEWLYHGFIRSSVKSKKVEDIGQLYINELCARGFFQDYNEFSGISSFKMHDLFHDLALSIAQKELNTMKGDMRKKENYKRIIYASFSGNKGLGGEKVRKLFSTKNSGSSCVMPTIWSVFFDKVGGGADCITQLVKTCISELEHLRFLDLSGTASLERLPSSIGCLKHLRYLNLAGCKRLKRLPDSICQLYNLQSLFIGGCAEFEELPKNIGDLVNLIELSITTRQKRLYEGIESSSSLRNLRLCDCENLEYMFESGANETQQPLLWTSLEKLLVENCTSLRSLVPWTPSVKILSQLDTLFITKCPNIDMASVFNDQFRFVRLAGCYLVELPQMKLLPEWISATTLETLAIFNCPNLTSLPDWLPNLTSLTQLAITNCPKLWRMPQAPAALKCVEIQTGKRRGSAQHPTHSQNHARTRVAVRFGCELFIESSTLTVVMIGTYGAGLGGPYDGYGGPGSTGWVRGFRCSFLSGLI